MNKILKLLKVKSLKGLGRLTALAWLFTADTPDRDALSVTECPNRTFFCRENPLRARDGRRDSKTGEGGNLKGEDRHWI